MVNIRDNSTSPSARVEQYHSQPASRKPAQEWLFEIEEEYKPVLNLPKNSCIGDIHRMTTTNAQAVEETTGISVTAETGFAFDGISASLSATASHELKITTTQQEVQTHSTEVSIERKYFASKRVTEAIWYRSDRYVLERLDGSQSSLNGRLATLTPPSPTPLPFLAEKPGVGKP